MNSHLSSSQLLHTSRPTDAQSQEVAHSLHIRPRWDAATTSFRHTWRGLVNVDQFRWMVRRDMQEQLALAHDELGARHVRAVGIFDDEMRVLGKSPRGFHDPSQRGHRLNWQLVDYVIDSLLDIGINPMFTTTFTPSVLASKEFTCFETKANSSVPNDWDAWSELITKTLEHFVWRYGRSRVRQWYMEAWNEPNLNPPFFSGNQADFFRLWKVTHDAIKSVDKDFRIGGPSTARCEWIEEFIKFGRANECEPDFIIGHIYNNDSEGSPLSPLEGPQEDRESRSPNFADAVIRGCRHLLDSMNFRGELQWNEWGRSWHPCDPPRESANEAAFAVKSMAAISQEVTHLAPWCLSDIYDQAGYGAETFHGNYGLLNLQGLRKPAYQAYQLLSRLSNQRVPTDETEGSKCHGALVTSTDSGFSALVYLYDHEGKATDAEITIVLPDGAQPRDLRMFRVDSRENNIVAHWKKNGAPDYLTRDETEAYRQRNVLQSSASTPEYENGHLLFDMEPGSIALIECDM